MTADEANQTKQIESARRKANAVMLATLIDSLLSTIEGKQNVNLVVHEARASARLLIETLSA